MIQTAAAMSMNGFRENRRQRLRAMADGKSVSQKRKEPPCRPGRLSEMRYSLSLATSEPLGNFSAFVSENPDGTIQLIELDRLLDYRHRTAGEDLTQDLAVWIACDDHDGHVRMQILELRIELITRDVGQFEIEEDKIKGLAFREAQSFRTRTDDDAPETGLFKKLFEEGLESRVIIDDEDSRLPSFFIPQDVPVEKTPFDAPAPSNLDCWQLSALDKVVDGWERDAEVFRCLLYSQ